MASLLSIEGYERGDSAEPMPPFLTPISIRQGPSNANHALSKGGYRTWLTDRKTERSFPFLARLGIPFYFSYLNCEIYYCAFRTRAILQHGQPKRELCS